MSRVGKKPIEIPNQVEVEIDNNIVKVKGPRGELLRSFLPNIKIEKKGNFLILGPNDFSRQTIALWGTYHSLIDNMIKGVKDGFEKTLIFEGVGYKAQVKNDPNSESGQVLELNVGFSHPVLIEAPKGIGFRVEKNQISVFGIDKELVGQIAAKIRKIRPPEPYKGTGIRYKDEIIVKKAGKKAVTVS